MISIDDAYAHIREADRMRDISKDAASEEEVRACMKTAFYQLYKGASLAHSYMGAAKAKRAGADSGVYAYIQDEMAEMTRVLARDYYAKGLFDGDGKALYDMWRMRCKRFVDTSFGASLASWNA